MSGILEEQKSGKHTVYVDIDDEITAIIDKVKSAPDKIVALVLPKRATVLQSTVNMKLLKKSALAAKKSLVLITSEAGLMPLAGAVGLHVAKSLQSKPEIPLPPDHSSSEESEISEVTDEEDVEVDKTKTIGDLSASAAQPADDETETIELDDVDVDDEEAQYDKKQKKTVRGFKIPNFDRFRLSFFLVILGIILLVTGWVFAAIVLPKATVVIQTDTTTLTSDVNFTASTAIKDLSVDQAQVPAVQKEIKKTDTEKATATGKKDNGTKATGSLTIKNCEDSSTRGVAAGTAFTSAGKTYVSDAIVSVPAGTFSGGGTNCTSPTVNVAVTASDNGESYNMEAATYTTSSSALSGNFRITGTAMAGGTSKIVTVVAQNDVDAAVAKMKGRQDVAAATELSAQLKSDSLKGLDETKVISEPAITSVPAVGAEVTGDITVTSVTTYNILGVKLDYLGQLIKKNVGTKIDTAKQGILDDGIGAAVIHVTNRKSATEAQMSIHTLVIAGPQLDANAIKEQIRGKKRGDAENLISSRPGVRSVTITYKPFWVMSTPKSVKKINVTIEKPVVKPATGGQTSNDSNP